jgi:hypothetical protein
LLAKPPKEKKTGYTIDTKGTFVHSPMRHNFVFKRS